jgi:hypothetical protein
MWNKFIGYLRECISEDGVGSYSRLSGLLVVLSSIAWVSYVVIRTHSIPDLGGVTGFIAGGNSMYAANQAKKIASAIKGTAPQTPNPNIPPDGQNG